MHLGAEVVRKLSCGTCSQCQAYAVIVGCSAAASGRDCSTDALGLRLSGMCLPELQKQQLWSQLGCMLCVQITVLFNVSM